MTALAQGTSGVALVMCFGLLGTQQVGAASLLLAIQSLAVAIAALAQHQPLIAAVAAINVIGTRWLLNALRSGVETGAAVPSLRTKREGLTRPASQGLIQRAASASTGQCAEAPAEQPHEEPIERSPARSIGGASVAPMRRPLPWRSLVPAAEPSARPIGGVKLGMALGAGLTVLCQLCGPLALPLAVLLLSVLLAAAGRHPLMRLTALVSLQNGIALAACLTVRPSLPGLACFVLPVPFAAALALGDTARRPPDIPKWIDNWSGWAQLAVSIGLLVVSLRIPLDPLASVFAPLVAVWGMAEAWAARNRTTQSVTYRGAALAKLGFMVVGVSTTYPVLAWIAVAGTIAARMFPALRRRWDGILLAFCAAGLGLFGLLTIPSGLPAVSYTALFIGYAALAAVVPELGVVIVIVIMRLLMRPHPPAIAATVLISVALAGLLGCSVLLAIRFAVPSLGMGPGRRTTDPHRATLLQLAQTSLAATAVGLGLPEARFAAIVLLILLTLTHTAARISHGPTAAAARAGLAGIPPFGVFPGLVLILLAISHAAAWLLLPVGLSLAVLFAVSAASERVAGYPAPWTWSAFRSVGLLPLALAFLFGFFTPDDLVGWLRTVTAGAP